MRRLDRIVWCAAFALALAAPALSAEPPRWVDQVPLGDAPRPRELSSGVYDPARDRMVMFGGCDGGPVSESRVLLLNGRPKWADAGLVGDAPSGAWDHSAVLDPARDRMVVFGGIGPSASDPGIADRDQTMALALDGAEGWRDLGASLGAPPARDGHSAILDPVRDRMIVFAGGGFDGLLGDLWALSLGPGTWSELQGAGDAPAPRARHSAIYDPPHDRMLVFGGATFDGKLLDDLWELSLANPPTWTQLHPLGTPPAPRAGHRAVYDPPGHRMLVFGGYQEREDPFAGDVWELTLGDTLAWRPLQVAGSPPAGRFSPLMVYDERERSVVVLAGTTATPDDDVWSLDLREDDDVAAATAFTISPNPARATDASLSFYLPEAGEVSLELLDLAGRSVWSRRVGALRAGWHVLPIGASLRPGVYWVRARVDARSMTARVVVVR